MKTSIIQSLIDRNASEIHYIEERIADDKESIKRAYKFGSENIIPIYKANLSKHRQTLKKLVAIQKELKKELADNIRNENYNSYLTDMVDFLEVN